MENNVEYKILNPGGNKTALVYGTEFSKEEKKKINDEILEKNTDVEQVGFLDKKNCRLEMAGGEFCVNATRCAIWECLEGKEGKIEISVSGCKEKIVGGITQDKKVYANMLVNNTIDNLVEKKEQYTVVKLDGIVLLVVSEDKSRYGINKLKADVQKTKLELKELMKETKIEEKAMGVILLEKENGTTKINPIIWVKEVDTLYYETACGSGSLATAIYKNSEEGIEELDVLQPSGYNIHVKLNVKEGFIRNAVITGVVE